MKEGKKGYTGSAHMGLGFREPKGAQKRVENERQKRPRLEEEERQIILKNGKDQ